jgi:hypothetical protein
VALIEDFFVDVDRAWQWSGPERIALRIIGSGALMLLTDYSRATKDSDVWHALGLPDVVARRLTQIAGRDSAIHARRRLYIDIVPNGLPLMPYPVRFHPIVALNTKLTAFAIEALDVVDVAVTKLKRFHADDRSDIAAMIDRGLVPYDEFKQRFFAAVDRVTDEEKRPGYFRNLNQVERDQFGVEETASPYDDD